EHSSVDFGMRKRARQISLDLFEGVPRLFVRGLKLPVAQEDRCPDRLSFGPKESALVLRQDSNPSANVRKVLAKIYSTTDLLFKRCPVFVAVDLHRGDDAGLCAKGDHGDPIPIFS